MKTKHIEEVAIKYIAFRRHKNAKLIFKIKRLFGYFGLHVFRWLV